MYTYAHINARTRMSVIVCLYMHVYLCMYVRLACRPVGLYVCMYGQRSTALGTRYFEATIPELYTDPTIRFNRQAGLLPEP